MLHSYRKLVVFTFIFLLLPLQAAAVDFNVQLAYNPNHTLWNSILVPWAQDVAKKSNGTLSLHLLAAGSIVDMNETGPATKDGLIDIGSWTPFAHPKNSPYTFITSIPGFGRSSQQSAKAMQAWMERVPEANAEVEAVGVPLAIWTAALTSIVSITDQPVRRPEDLKGRRVMVITSGLDARIVETWGGIPVLVSVSDLYIGLQRGMADACFGPPPFLKSCRVQELAKSITFVPSITTVMFLSANRETFNELTTEQQNALLQASEGLGDTLASGIDRDTLGSLNVFAEAGCEVIQLTPEEQQVFDASHDVLNPNGFWISYLAAQGVKGDIKEWVEKALEVSRQVEGSE